MTDGIVSESKNRWQPSQRTALFLSSLTLFFYSLYILSGTAEFLYQWSKDLAPYEVRQHLGISKRFLLQYGHIVFLFILLFLSRYIFISSKSLPFTGHFIGQVAKYTPAVFLIHFPVLYFLGAVTHHNPQSDIDQILLLAGTLALSILFGRLCFFIKPAFDRSLNGVSQWMIRKQPKDQDRRSAVPLSLTSSHSEFLNLVKIFSMIAVVLGHFSFREFTHYTVPGFDGSAPRFAVPLFFILSGYFLMISIDRSKVGASVLLLKKIWSLYYLIIPMLIIVPFLDNIGYEVNAQIYQFKDYYVFERERGPLGAPIFIATLVNSLLYLNEIWIYTLMGMSDMKGGIVAFSNDPYWFLCYLIPFTILLIIWRMSHGVQKYVLLCIACLIFGPPILLLSPLFFAGSLAYILHKRVG